MAAPVRLIVLNYNGGAFVLECLDALHRLDWPTDDLELVLVDNASTDGSADAVAARFPAVRIIRNDRNTGFPANNLGLRDLQGVRYVGLVNNDGFVEPDWLRHLAAALDDDPTLGAAAAKLVFAPRFVDVRLQSPTFAPGPGDPRQLGVQLRAVRVAGEDAWGDAQLAEGGGGLEHDRDGPFQWTTGDATLRIPVPPPAATHPAPARTSRGDDRPPAATDGVSASAGVLVPVELELAAPRATKVTITSGSETVTVEVGPGRATVAIRAAGEPYDVVQNAGSMVLTDGSGADRGFLQRDDGRWDESTEVFAWCGGSVLFRADYVEQTGAFDERFFLYYEDTDWSWRGRAQGWRYRYVPEAVMRHKHAATSGEGSAVFAHHVERNRLLMLVKDAPARLALAQVLRFVLVTASYARRDVVGPLRRGHRPNPTTVRRRIGSFIDFLRLLPAMVRDRRALRRRQVVPDRELVAWLVPPHER